jgi:alkylation response protein AidB-like acyl-CoA dehydrogenase
MRRTIFIDEHDAVDWCIEGIVSGELTADEAAQAKSWVTETEWEILDRCVQLHGGDGYINEFEIARLWRDGRVQRRSLGL